MRARAQIFLLFIFTVALLARAGAHVSHALPLGGATTARTARIDGHAQIRKVDAKGKEIPSEKTDFVHTTHRVLWQDGGKSYAFLMNEAESAGKKTVFLDLVRSIRRKPNAVTGEWMTEDVTQRFWKSASGIDQEPIAKTKWLHRGTDRDFILMNLSDFKASAIRVGIKSQEDGSEFAVHEQMGPGPADKNGEKVISMVLKMITRPTVWEEIPFQGFFKGMEEYVETFAAKHALVLDCKIELDLCRKKSPHRCAALEKKYLAEDQERDRVWVNLISIQESR